MSGSATGPAAARCLSRSFGVLVVRAARARVMVLGGATRHDRHAGGGRLRAPRRPEADGSRPSGPRPRAATATSAAEPPMTEAGLRLLPKEGAGPVARASLDGKVLPAVANRSTASSTSPAAKADERPRDDVVTD